MGNRAIITSASNYNQYKMNSSGVGIYIHWNGDIESVRAFVEYCRLRGVRNVENDEAYAFARLTQIISNFFGGNLSVGVGNLNELDLIGNNGMWIVNKDWKITKNIWIRGDRINDEVKRVRNTLSKKQKNDLKDMLVLIDNSQPINSQLGEDYLRADEVPISELKIGDWVFEDINEQWHYDFYQHKETSGRFRYKVQGIGSDADEIFNGKRTFGIPYYIDDSGEVRYMYHTTYRKTKAPTKDQAKWQERIANSYWGSYEECEYEEDKETEAEENILEKYQYALTFNYYDDEGNTATYLHKTEKEAQEEIDQVFLDITKELQEDKNIPIQVKTSVNNSHTIYSLSFRTPYDEEYHPCVIATVSKIYF